MERVHFGVNCIARLGEELDRLGSERPFVVTGRTIADETSLVDQIEHAAGRKLAGVFGKIRQHTPESDIRSAINQAKSSRADSLISLGGGSPIDATKIVVKELSQNFKETALAHVAVPTTLSAAEFSHSAGVTDEKLNRKTGFRDLRMVPRIIFLDPVLTKPTPAWLWASTGVRSLDHAVEAVLSDRHQPYVDTLALEAIRLLFQNLKPSSDDSSDLNSRGACQSAAWMSYAGALSVGTGVSHAIGRVIGATWGIPHGITSCLTLAEVMRSQARQKPDRLIPIALAEGKSIEGVSGGSAALSAADGVAELVSQLGLSKRLRDYKIEKKDLPRIAEQVGAIEGRDFVLDILEKIW
ncbi:MAG TPA: iron-containing alcohol dehydrogenase [Candidatus Bathyarchaeia archaeon]|nr:iron-containing alcohol dehydrogenase [Candidatus Bathyarchaeia archaeon]